MPNFSDDFNRANGGLGANHTTAVGTPVINGNRVRASGAELTGFIVTAAGNVLNGSVAIELPTVDPDSEWTLNLRFVDLDNRLVVAYSPTEGNTVLGEFVAGVYTELDSIAGNATAGSVVKTTLNGGSVLVEVVGFGEILSGTTAWTTTGVVVVVWDPISAGAVELDNIVIVDAVDATIAQAGFRPYDDDGSESAATPYGPQDTNFTAPTAVNKIVRLLVQATGDPASKALTLRQRKNGSGSYEPVVVGNTAPSVSWGDIGTHSAGTNSCTPSYPTAGTAGGYWYLACVTGRSNTATTDVSAPSGWTAIGSSELEGGTGTWGDNTGTRRVEWFIKDAITGSESGTETFAYASGSNAASTISASIVRVDFPVGHTLSVAATTGADTTNGTGYSATGSAGLSFLADDLLLVGTAQNIDTGTQSSEAITATDVTFGTLSNRRSQAVTNGNDHRHIIVSRPVSSVTGTPTSAPTYSYTISASGSGPSSFLRLRSVAPQIYISPSANITAGGEATTQRLTGGTGSFTTGRMWDDENGSDSIDIGEDDNTELAWSLQLLASLSDGDYFDLLVYDGADALTGTPARWTVGTPGETGSGAVALGNIEVAGAGDVGRFAAGGITLGRIGVTGGAIVGRSAAGIIALGGIEVSGVGSSNEEVTGDGDVTLGGVEVAGAGQTGRVGSGTVALGGVDVAGAGTAGRAAAGAVDLGGIEVSGAGASSGVVSGDGAVSLGGVEVSGAGQVGREAAGAVVLGGLDVAGAGTVGRAGAAAVLLGGIEVAGAGVVGRSGTASIALGSIKVAGSGTGFAIITGEGDVSLGGIEVAAAGIVGRIGAAAITLGKVTVSGAAVVGRSAEAAIALGGIEVVGAGMAERFGVGVVALGGIEVAGAGAVFSGEFASASVVLGGIEVAGAGVVGRFAAGAVTLGPLAVAGAVDIGKVGAGSITLGGIRVQASEAGGSGIGGQQYIIYMDRDMRDPWRKGMRVW